MDGSELCHGDHYFYEEAGEHYYVVDCNKITEEFIFPGWKDEDYVKKIGPGYNLFMISGLDNNKFNFWLMTPFESNFLKRWLSRYELIERDAFKTKEKEVFYGYL